MADKFTPFRRIQEGVSDAINNKRWIRFGIVSKVRKDDRKVRIKLLPELVETNWLRVYFFNAGDNYMTGALPEVESEVVVMFIEGMPEGAFVLAGGFVQNGDNPAPLTDDLDLNIMDKNGNRVRMDANGVTIDSPHIFLGADAAERLIKGDAFKAFFNAHTVATPFGPSGPPIQPMLDTHLSSVSKTK
jgi:hypothetical protein